MQEISAEADRTARRTAAATDTMSTKMRKVGTGATAMGRAMVAASVPLIGLGYFSAKAAINFQAAMEQIHTQAGASQSEVDAMSKSVLGMTRTMQYAQGPQDLAKGLYHIESIGLRGKTALDALKIASQGAAVGGTNLEDTATALGAAMKATGGNAGDLTHLMGTLNGIVGAGNMRMADLVQALGTGAVPAFENAGLTIKDFGGALAVLVDQGYQASSASAQMATALHFLYDPSAKANKALASMGMSATQMAADLHQPQGLLVALRDLHSHLANLSPVDAEQKLGAILPGGRGRVFLTLLRSLDLYQGKLDRVGKTSNSLTEDIRRTHETAAFKIKAAWSGIQGAMVQFGATLLPIIATVLPPLVHLLTGLFDWLRKLPGPVKDFGVAFAGFLLVGGGLLIFFGKLFGSLASIRSGWLALSGQAARSNAQIVASSESTAGSVIASNSTIEGSNAVAGESFTKVGLSAAGARVQTALAAGGMATAVVSADTTIEAANLATRASFMSMLGWIGLVATAAMALEGPIHKLSEMSPFVHHLPAGSTATSVAQMLVRKGAHSRSEIRGFVTKMREFGQLQSAQIDPIDWSKVKLRYARGGIVPRIGHGVDRIPALLTGGEGVVNPEGMQKLGAAGLAALNNGGDSFQLPGGQVIIIQPQPNYMVVDGRVLAGAVSRFVVNKAARGTSSLVGGPLLTGVSGAIDLGN